MFAVENKAGQVKFTFKPGEIAQDVAIAGTFSNWKPICMRRDPDGTFEAKLVLKPGTHEYRFIVDHQWITDPGHRNLVVVPRSVAAYEAPHSKNT